MSQHEGCGGVASVRPQRGRSRGRPRRWRSAIPKAWRSLPRIVGACAGVALVLASAVPVAAHNLTGRYASPLPLAAYLVGAAIAVALSFAFVLLRDERPVDGSAGPARDVSPRLRWVLRAVGLIAWLWVVAQTIVGEAGDADVASLFLWVYGWVGVAAISAFAGPIWRWLDPFTTLHDLAAAVLRRFGLDGWEAAPYPSGLAHWPAVLGFAAFVWLELAFKSAAGGRNLGIVMLAYTAVTLAGMAQYGRDAWRENGETFSVWFGTLGRLAPFAAADADATRLQRRPFPLGLTKSSWDASRVVLVAMATASIIYDGLSQTRVFLDTFGVPGLPGATLLLFAFLLVVTGAVLAVSRVAGLAALGAGLVPIAVGYLVAHYLTYLLGDGQRIVVALSDPLGRGWDLIGMSHYEPGLAWLPSGIVWAAQFGAVVGGHVVGAWAGHRAALATSGRAREDVGLVRRRQVPLAVLMVSLTVLTLWSLGQVVVQEPAAPAASAGRAGEVVQAGQVGEVGQAGGAGQTSAAPLRPSGA